MVTHNRHTNMQSPLVTVCLCVLGDAIFFHCNVLHRSDRNTSDQRRWAFVISYNRADNNPVKQHHHPFYTPLHMARHSTSIIPLTYTPLWHQRAANGACVVFYWLENSLDCSVMLCCFQVENDAILKCKNFTDFTGKVHVVFRRSSVQWKSVLLESCVYNYLYTAKFPGSF